MIERSWWEIVLFALLAALSAAGFWWRFRKVFHTIVASKRDADFQLQPVAKRAWDFFWEVMCQAKVIRERPLPGLAHAFVFWGFCAFAIVTLDHFLGGLNVDFLRYDRGVFGPFYFGLAFLFAVAVSVSITGLAIRRFLVRPKWLGVKVSWESGIIAGLILTLMLTYIADYVLRDHGARGHVIWWLHTLALLVFLPLVPHTKHLHLVLESGDGVVVAWIVQPDSAACGRRRLRARHGQGCDATTGAAGVSRAWSADAARNTAPPTRRESCSTPRKSHSDCGRI